MKTITFDPNEWKLVPVTPTAEQLRAGYWSGAGEIRLHEEWARKESYERMVHNAPKPPEVDMGNPISAAAPVQLPEPVAAESRFTTFAGNRWRWCTVEHARAFGADKGYEVRYLYTEQQVRQLLAAHGIKEQST